MALPSVPSVYTQRMSLEQLEGAIRLEPWPEDSAAGTYLGTPLYRLDPDEFDTDLEVPSPALDTLIFYPDPFQIDWQRCPILLHKHLNDLGIGVDFYETIGRIVESPSFLKSVSRLGRKIETIW